MRKGSVQVASTDAGYLIRVEGHCTLQQSPALQAFVTQALQDSPLTIAVDLCCCDYMDSTSLGCLLTVHRRAQASPPSRVVVVADLPARKRLLSSMRLDRILTLTDFSPATVSPFVRLHVPQLNKLDLGRHVARSHEALAGVAGDHAQVFRQIAEQLNRELKDGF